MTRSLNYKKEALNYFWGIIVAVSSVILVKSPWIIEATYLKERFGESFYVGVKIARASLSEGTLFLSMMICMLIIVMAFAMFYKKKTYIKVVTILVSILCMVGSSKLMAEFAIPIDKLMGVNSGEEYAIAVVMKKQMTLYYPIIMVTYAMSSYYGLVFGGLKKGTIAMGSLFASTWILLILRCLLVAEVLSWSGVGCYSVAIASLIAVLMIGIMWIMRKIHYSKII